MPESAAPRARPISAERSRPLRRAVLRPHQSCEELVREDPVDAYYVGVEQEGEIVAVGRVRPEGEPGEWRVSAMATAEPHRGRGLGAIVLRELVGHARATGASGVWCHARLGAVDFYAREGWRVTSEVFEVPMIGPHRVMARRLRP